ncbi:hypothetical protein J2Z31_001805 [Sinorhizobium kostiense]|uniref:Uncharacterized protein n=1 Tax=Sinorhizobium kostiense TaxID=76747 RepID=A0ABS4QXE4_9HYPH|nr:hypothetical protein [Sinorhizobium kostiense]MBP2235313.1 hypothetical protein [Sinorhizobium kostiense]
MNINSERAPSEHDGAKLLCHAKPSLRNLLLRIINICMGAVFIWAFVGLPASSTVREHIFSLLVLALGVLLACGGAALLLGPIFGYPRLTFGNNRLVFVGVLGRSVALNLGELGKATVFQSAGGTWLAFFTLDEERAMAANAHLVRPNGVNAAKYVPVFPLIGNNSQAAQELADQINAIRNSSHSDDFGAGDAHANIQKIKQRGRRRTLTYFLVVGAVLIMATLL